MLSIETEARLAKLFLSLAQGERAVEINRQVLCGNYDFDAYQVFKFLDTEGKNRVDVLNIIDYLRSKNIYCTEQEVQLLILFYDEDADGSLSYGEFLNLAQSSQSIQRNSSNSNGHLSFNVDYSLGKLLLREIEMARTIISWISDLKVRCDFNIHDWYHSTKGYDAITSDSIKHFLDRNGASFLDSDIKAIIKRLDFNCDGKVDLNEFHTFLGFPTCLRCCQCTRFCSECICCPLTHSHLCCSPKRTCSPRRCSPHCSPRRCSPHCSPRRCSPHCSPKRETTLRDTNAISLSTQNQTRTSPQRNNALLSSGYNLRHCESPEVKKITPNLSLRLSPERRFSPNRTSNMNCSYHHSPCHSPNRSNNISSYRFNSKINDNYEKKQFIDYWTTVMDAESEIERQKINLALQSDFNVEDAFRVFELNGRGFLTEEDLKYGLNLLDVYPTNSDIRLLMKRFDWLKEGTINYSNFFDIVTPFEEEYRTMVEKRPPNSCCTCRCPDIFKYNTKLHLKNLFKSLIDFENKFNMLKRGYSNWRYKWRDIYREIDTIGLGYFKEKDLSVFLRLNNAFTSVKNSDLLFIRWDKNRNNKVEFYEIEDELSNTY